MFHNNAAPRSFIISWFTVYSTSSGGSTLKFDQGQ